METGRLKTLPERGAEGLGAERDLGMSESQPDREEREGPSGGYWTHPAPAKHTCSC